RRPLAGCPIALMKRAVHEGVLHPRLSELSPLREAGTLEACVPRSESALEDRPGHIIVNGRDGCLTIDPRVPSKVSLENLFGRPSGQSLSGQSWIDTSQSVSQRRVVGDEEM